MTIRTLSLRGPLQRFQAAASRLPGSEAGIAAVEFALILPILLTLWIGGVEVTQALSFDRRLNNLAASIGDIVARSKMLTYQDVDDVFDIATGAMFPFDGTGISMVVTAINIDADGAATVAWSRAEGAVPARVVDEDVNALVAETLRVPDTQIIMSEVYGAYAPALGYVITGTLDLDERLFYVPRLTSAIKLCDTSAETNCLS